MGVTLHLDMDSFFASVEQAIRPELFGKPVAISAARGQSIVVTASYEAKDQGVKVGMLKSEATKLCPSLTFLLSRMEAYSQVGREVRKIVERYVPYYETLGLDELFMELRDVRKDSIGYLGEDLYELGELLGETLRKEVREKLNLNISVGIGSNKATAKLATKLAKPDGLLSLKGEKEREVLYGQKIDVITGIGPASQRKLRASGYETIGELAGIKKNILEQICGKAQGRFIYHLVNFENMNTVTANPLAKSLGISRIIRKQEGSIEETLEELAGELLVRLQRSNRGCKSVIVVVSSKDGGFSASRKFGGFEKNKAIILKTIRELYQECPQKGEVNFLGITLTNLSSIEQPSLFGEGINIEMIDKPLLKSNKLSEEIYKMAYYGMEIKDKRGALGVVREFKEGGLLVDFSGTMKILEYNAPMNRI